jgi:Xaa-Pro dipeptidase
VTHDRVQQRLTAFQERLAAVADVAFFPRSADLQYLAGVPRDIPNYGAVMHPGAWVEGAWLSPGAEPLLALPRMTAEFGGLAGLGGVRLHVLADDDDPAAMVRGFLDALDLPATPRIAIGDATHGETVSALQRLLPSATFVSATDLLRPLRVVKSEAEIDVMRRAGAITEAAFADVLTRLEHGMTELDVVTEVDHQLRRHGSLGPSFTTSLYTSGRTTRSSSASARRPGSAGSRRPSRSCSTSAPSSTATATTTGAPCSSASPTRPTGGSSTS